jgi:hypothetical protein
MTYFCEGVTGVFAVHTPCAPVRKVARVGSRNHNPRVGVQVPPPLPTMFVRSGEARFAEWREFEELEGTAPVPAQGPAWAHRCAPRRFGSTDLSIGPGQGDAAEPGTSTLILC